MSELDPKTLQRELLLEEKIEKQLDKLVGQATETMLVLGPNTRMEENQLRNLLNVSLDSPSVEVVANFIRYQIARKERDWGINKDGFGHTVIKDLYGFVKDLADKVIEQIQTEFKLSAEKAIS